MVEFSSTMNLTWEDLNQFNEDVDVDHLITYLLFQEGKSTDLISKIRNLSKETVQEHILHSKIKLKKKETTSYHPSFVALLAADKNHRLKLLEGLNQKEKDGLVSYLKKVLPTIDNAEDKMIALWIAGQLKEIILLAEICNEIEHKHGGVRRMVCSALRRIPHKGNLDVLHRGLQDVKPQVRQYAAKALEVIGDEKTVKRLKNLLNNPKEMEYVKRTYLQTIDIIEERISGKRG